MTGKFGLRIYLVGAVEGFNLTGLHSTAWNEVRSEAQRIAQEGLWRTDTEFIPPARLASIYVTKL